MFALCNILLIIDFQMHRVLHTYLPNFDDSPFISQLTQEKVKHLFRKPWIVAVESSNENGSKSVMVGSRQVFVNVVYFHFSLNFDNLLFLSQMTQKKTYAPLSKDLNSEFWKQQWKMKQIYPGRSHTNLRKSGTFSFIWGWRPEVWKHAQ